MTERRFNEADVAAILEKPADAQRTRSRQLPSGEGMTLVERRRSVVKSGSTRGSSRVGWITGGLTMFGVGALRLPGWSRLRRKQMEEIAGRVAGVSDSPPE